MTLPSQWRDDLVKSVRLALDEDIQTGDITAELIPAEDDIKAKVITREDAVICGIDWVNETFKQIDQRIRIQWQCKDGDKMAANTVLFTVQGPARSLLTAERTALNFLQLLSGIATRCAQYAEEISHTQVKLLDTRKTIPGLRTAQKYAVSCGGCANHRIGLFDAFLIKENHIAACGGVEKAVAQAKQNHPDKPVEIEVETLAELEQALQAQADIIMLDNFSNEDKVKAVAINAGRAKLEASGNITFATLKAVAETGVDYISLGTLTKDITAIDLSMRIME